MLVDTSALFALLDEDDENHPAASAWISGPGKDPGLVLLTHNYVLVESAALIHRRLGPDAVRVLLDGLVPALSIHWVDQQLHQRAAAAYLASARRGVSLVDRVSFEVMRDLGLEQAFAFDRDFVDEGFASIPSAKKHGRASHSG